jgi:hypothetical protein
LKITRAICDGIFAEGTGRERRGFLMDKEAPRVVVRVRHRKEVYRGI